MKKYTLFLVAFFFVLGFFNINLSKVEAIDCASGDLFSSVTGKPCSTNTTTTNVTGNVFYRNLSAKLKSRGEDVKALQQFLKDEGYLFGKVDGKFGKVTGRAVGDFQEDNDLPRTEVADPATREMLNTLVTTEPVIINPLTPSAPVISGVSGPQSLNVNQTGTWTVKASDPEKNRHLGYSVIWGDEEVGSHISAAGQIGGINLKVATFTHNYAKPGKYTPRFFVSNDYGGSVEKILNVTVVDGTSILAPVVSGVSGPQSLKVNQTGTWTVKASSKDGGDLSYSVSWGDEGYPAVNGMSAFRSPQQSATFTHSYSQIGTYKVTFKVTSENTIRCITTPCPSNAGSAETSITVNVGDTTTNSLVEFNRFSVGENKYRFEISSNEKFDRVQIVPDCSDSKGVYIFSSLLGKQSCRSFGVSLRPTNGISHTLSLYSTDGRAHYTTILAYVYYEDVFIGKESLQITIDPIISGIPVPSIISILPAGCVSNMGWSSVTGEPCSNPRTSANYEETVYIYGSGFGGQDADVFISSPGMYESSHATVISSSLLKFTVPVNGVNSGRNGIMVEIGRSQGRYSSNTVYLDIGSSVPTETKLNVGLASNFNPLTTLKAGVTNTEVLRMNLLAGGGDVSVSGINFNFYGTCSSVKNLSLRDNNSGYHLAAITSLTEKECDARFNFSTPLLLAKNSIKTLSLFTDISGSGWGDTGKIQFKLNKVNVSSLVSVEGISAVVGPIFTISNMPTPVFPPTIYSVFPVGCSSNSGWNSITGESCSSAKIGDSVYVSGSDFNVTSKVIVDNGNYNPVDGSGPVIVDTVRISSTLLSFVVPSNMSPGIHSIKVDVADSSSNAIYLNIVPGTITTPITPTLTVARDPSTPIAQTISTGALNVDLLHFSVAAQDGDVSIVQISLGSDQSVIGTDLINNIRIYDENNTFLGSVETLPNMSSTKWGSVNISTLVIPSGTKKVLKVKADVTQAGNGHFLYLEVIGMGYSGNQPPKYVDLGTKGYRMTIRETASLSITTTSPLPNAKVGVQYQTYINATGGVESYGWNTGSSSFPPGLAFGLADCTSSNPCYASVPIVGIPTTAGTYTFTLQAISGSQTSIHKQFTLTVEPALSVAPGKLVIDPSSVSVNVNENVRVKAMYTQGCPISDRIACRPMPVEVNAEWSLDDTSLARLVYAMADCPTYSSSCSSYTFTNLTGLIAGATKLKATYSESSGNVLTASVPVTVVGNLFLLKNDKPSLSASAISAFSSASPDGANTENIVSEKYHFTLFLEEGSSGDEVIELQKYLNEAGYDVGKIDGFFGPKVKIAVMKFQTDNKLKSDGIVGYQMRTFLNK